MSMINKILTLLVSLVWLINGLLCKLLNLVPRHQEIVARILGEGHADLFTKLIGVSEVLMFAWIISRIKSRLCSVVQIIIIATMNIIEFLIAPDLLLFGRLNIVLAMVLIVVIFINEFVLNKTAGQNKI